MEFIIEVIVEGMFVWVGGTIRWLFFNGLLQSRRRTYADYLGDEGTNTVLTVLLILLPLVWIAISSASQTDTAKPASALWQTTHGPAHG